MVASSSGVYESSMNGPVPACVTSVPNALSGSPAAVYSSTAGLTMPKHGRTSPYRKVGLRLA